MTATIQNIAPGIEMSKIRIKTRQLPVGQGGLMISTIASLDDTTSHPFTFIFDCGSLNREHIGQGLDLLHTLDIDVLFISHLDADHANGVDMLIQRGAKIDTVVLPCLDPTTIAACILAEANGAGMTTEFDALLRNPARWFGTRGVRRVLYLQRPAPDATPPSPDTVLDEIVRLNNPNRDSGLAVILRTRAQRHLKPRTAGSAEVIELDADTVIDVASSQAPTTTLWTLVPYHHPFGDDLVDAFHAAAKTAIVRMPRATVRSSSTFAALLLRAIGDKDQRDVLKACYRILDTDGNVPSLSLYSGPPTYNDSVKLHPAATHRRAGWLTTGDAKLKAKWVREPWMARYDAMFRKVGVFVLPHHGSDYSIDPRVLAKLPHARMLSCAASGSKKHPHKNVLKKLAALGISHHVVSEKLTSTYPTYAIAYV